MWGRHLVRPKQNQNQDMRQAPGQTRQRHWAGRSGGGGQEGRAFGRVVHHLGGDCGQFEFFVYFLMKFLGLRVIFVVCWINWRSDKGLCNEMLGTSLADWQLCGLGGHYQWVVLLWGDDADVYCLPRYQARCHCHSSVQSSSLYLVLGRKEDFR